MKWVISAFTIIPTTYATSTNRELLRLHSGKVASSITYIYSVVNQDGTISREQSSGKFPAAPSAKPKLLDSIGAAIRTRHYGRRIEEAYVDRIRRFIIFHGKRHPTEMREREINAFLTHLAVEMKVSASTQNQALPALLSLYRYVIGCKTGELGDVIHARRPAHLPVVMTREKVKAVLANLSGDKWLMASLMYGTGLHMMECLRLRVQDIDFSRNEILVRDGRGAKDRVTMMPESLKKPLHDHLKKVKTIHEKDFAEGWGRVLLPDALDRKYPNSSRE